MGCCIFILTGGVPGKTAWSTVTTFWSGLGLPVWCSYGGVTCDSVAASQTYARIIGMDFSLAWIAGSLPSSIGNLRQIKILKLNDNSLGSTIPSSIGDLTALTYLSLGGNFLTGTIPSTIGGLTSLTSLELYRNKMNGTLPDAIGRIESLQLINLYLNSFVGTIPSTICTMTGLVSLFLSMNSLVGTIPTRIGAMGHRGGYGVLAWVGPWVGLQSRS